MLEKEAETPSKSQWEFLKGVEVSPLEHNTELHSLAFCFCISLGCCVEAT